MPDSQRRPKASATGDYQSSTWDSHSTHSTRRTRYSESLCDSNSTYSTIYSSAAHSLVKCSGKGYQHAEDDHPRSRPYDAELSPDASLLGPRDSVDTYASTEPDQHYQVMPAASPDEFICRQEEIPALPPYQPRTITSKPIPSDPDLFKDLFPSMRPLSIQHDHTTSDGNMNLRVDTTAGFDHGKALPVTLFHLRMHDLSRREFSFRRYCRDSGREICNAKRKYARATASPPAPSADHGGSRKRLSRHSSLSLIAASSWGSKAREHGGCALTPTNTIKLEFSNYARLEVERNGSAGHKRYSFVWWGHQYSWVRTTDGNTGAVSFHLMRDKEAGAVAHIVPDVRTPTQQADDHARGVWVPPCHMWIVDESVVNAMTDVSDVLVATGLLALVDDCIKERWEKKLKARTSHKLGGSGRRRVLSMPLPMTSQRVEFGIGSPARMVRRLFGGGGGGHGRRSHSETDWLHLS